MKNPFDEVRFLAESIDDKEKWGIKEWTKWFEENINLVPAIKLQEVYDQSCSMDAFQSNVRTFHKTDGMPIAQAVAASYSTLKKACGVTSKKQMTPSEIVQRGSK